MDKDWYKKEITDEGFRVVGHHHAVISADPRIKQVRPQDGYAFVVEMQKSWCLFVMKDLDWQRDPQEMYFATALLVDYKEK